MGDFRAGGSRRRSPGLLLAPCAENSGCRGAHPQASRSQIKSQQGKLGQSPLLSPAPPDSPAPCPLGRLPGVEAAAEAEVRARRSLSCTSSGARSRPFCPGPGPSAGLRAPARAARLGRFLDSARGGCSSRSRPATAPRAPPVSAPRGRWGADGGERGSRRAGWRQLAHLGAPGWRLRVLRPGAPGLFVV